MVGFPRLIHGDVLRGSLHHPPVEDPQVPVDCLLPLQHQKQGNASQALFPPQCKAPLAGIKWSCSLRILITKRHLDGSGLAMIEVIHCGEYTGSA